MSNRLAPYGQLVCYYSNMLRIHIDGIILFGCNLLYRSYVILFQLIVAAGMGPVLALKYFRYTYRSSKINILQQAERLGGPIMSLGSIEPQPRTLDPDSLTPLSISQPKSGRNSVFEPLLSDSPNSVRRSFGPGATFDFFQSQSKSSYYPRDKDN